MNNSLERLLDGIVGSLRTEIIPRLDDEFARGQAYAAADLLNNLRPRIDWAAAPLAAQIAAQRAVARRIDLLARELPQPPPRLPAGLETAAVGGAGRELKALRDRLDEHLCDVIDWLARRRADLPETPAAAIMAALEQYMQEQVRREVSLAAKPLFGEIAGNTSA